MASDPQFPRRIEAEVERLSLHEDYEFISATLRLADGRRMTLDFGRESRLARDILEVLAERLPELVAELHDGELLLTRIAPPDVDADDGDDDHRS